MAKFEIGSRVQVERSSERGTVIDQLKRPGKQMYKVVFDSGSCRLVHEWELIPIVDYLDPFDCCINGIFGSNREFQCVNTQYKIRNSNNNAISTLKASKTIFKTFQFKPLLKFLNSRNHRVLIADEVGLGKTIEAGHIMLEMAARNELGNALIVCPCSLREKWRDELHEKFGFNFRVYDHIDELVGDIKSIDGTIKAIINYEKLREKTAEPLYELLDNSHHSFDFILCDEAHRLRNDNQTSSGAIRLLSHPSAAVFLTATPVMTSQENLFNLLKMLDKEQYGNYAVFLNTLSINAPFVRAISQLNAHVDRKTVKEELELANVTTYYNIGDEYIESLSTTQSIKEKFADSGLFQRIINNLEKESLSLHEQVTLLSDLSSMSPMNNVFSRTRKKEVTEDWTQAERDTHTKIVTLYDDEKDEYDRVINERSEDQQRALGLVQDKIGVSSSVYAFLNTKEDLIDGIDRYEFYPDAKVEELCKIIKAVKEDGRNHLIVFATSRKNTLRYLAIRLGKLGYKTIQIHGDIPPKDRPLLLKEFKNAKEFTILLSSEVGSEGLDMQFCNAIVNYDLPWNPMVVEQRIGRIDRFGQKSPKVHIYNLVVKDSILVKIYDRLLERIGIFKSCIGDLEAILDKELEDLGIQVDIQDWFEQMERDYYLNALSDKEINERIDQIALAIQRNRDALEEYSKGLNNTLTNDLYFKNEVEAIANNRRYVTEQEIQNFISMVIEKVIPACQICEHPEISSAYILKVPHAQPRTLTSFLEKYAPIGLGRDCEVLNRQFKGRVTDRVEIPITFNQEVAYENPSLEYINAYHPLVTAAYVYFNKKEEIQYKAFSYEVEADELIKTHCVNGDYYLAVYVIRAEKTMFGKTQQLEVLTPVVYDFDKGEIIEDQEIVDHIYALAQSGSDINIKVYMDQDRDKLIDMQLSMEDKIGKERKKYIKDQSLLVENYKQIQGKQYSEYYDTQLKRYQSIYDKHQDEGKSSILSIDRYNIEKTEREKAEALDKINNADVHDQEHQLISISRITFNF